jgi:flagellar hook-associated protein 2
MVGFSIDGLFSGLDTTEIIEALLFNKRAPAERIAARRTATSQKLAAVNALNASVLGVRVAGQALGSANLFSSSVANSSNNDIVRATSNADASPGTFEISVQQLARAEQISSDANNVFTTDDEELGIEGQIRVNGVNVTIRDTDTLRDIANRISNSSNSVSASVIEVDDGQFRLSIRATSTGAEGLNIQDVSTNNLLEALRIGENSASDTVRNALTDGAASNDFAITIAPVQTALGLEAGAVPAGTVQISNGTETLNVALDLSTQSLEDIAQAINDEATAQSSSISASVVEVEDNVFQLQILSGDGTDPTFVDDGNVLETLGVVETAFTQVDQQGRDAEFRVNGIDVVRSTNTVSDVIEGVTLTLISDSEPTETADVSVTSTTNGAVEAVQAFVNAFNNTRAVSRQLASYNADTQQAGVLLGDVSIISVERGLGNLITRRLSTLSSQSLASLNSGAGVAPGSISITDRAGNSATLDLSDAENLQDVVDIINRNDDISVEAGFNSAGTGLVLRDTSGSLSGTLRVQEVGGGTTAADLGILGSGTGGTINGTALAEAEFLSLAQLGISANVDGTISLNTQTLQSFLNDNPSAVEAFFTQDGGFSDIAVGAVDVLTHNRNGILTTQAESLQDTIEDMTDSIEAIEERVALAEANLRRQFAALEESLAQLQEQGTFLQNQLSQISSLGNNRN